MTFALSSPVVYENCLAERLSLAGEWEIEIGGRRGPVQVPGVWEVHGYPHEIQVAIYRRRVAVPPEWDGARVTLCFGAVSYDVTARVNGVEVGRNIGLWHPFQFDVTAALNPGEMNEIALEIVKSGKDGQQWHYREVLVGFIPYVATTFGGPWQDVWLAAHRAPIFRNVHVAPDPQTGKVECSVWTDAPGEPRFTTITGETLIAEITDAQGNVVAQAAPTIEENHAAFTMQVENPVLWSPASPACYTLTLRLVSADQIVSETSRTFGYRRLQAEADRVLLNGQPIFLRGILSWGWDPETLAPTPTEAKIRDEFRRVRAMGFNMVKLCLFVPPPRLFEIADEEGMLLWLELPMWLPRLTERFRQQTIVEYSCLFEQVHHHPSVVVLSLGCELGADMADEGLLRTLSEMARATLSGALICDNSGSGEAYNGLAVDFADFNDYHFYCDLHEFRPLLDHFRRDWRPARPWLFGEFCDSDDYRDPDALTADPTYPWWRELFGVEGNLDRWAYPDQAERIQALNLPFTHQQIMDMSRKQSLVVRKTVLEVVRTRREIGGYVVTGLRDTPITTSGVFDDFGRPKFDAGQFRQFNADGVLMLEVGRARSWTHGGDRPAPIDPYNHRAGANVSHRVIYAGPPRGTGELHWRLTNAANQTICEAHIPTTDSLPGGVPQQIATINWTAPSVSDRAEQFILSVEVERVSNQWRMWVYSTPQPLPESVTLYDPAGQLEGVGVLKAHDFSTTVAHPGVLITSVFTPEVEAAAQAGGRVVLLLSGGPLTKPVPFWRESIKLLYDHPLLRDFPHDGFTDLQFYNLASDHALDNRSFTGTRITPIIRRLDARLFSVLDYLAEVQIGAGRMLVSTLNYCGGTGDQTRGFDANLAGRYLLGLMINYLYEGAVHENECHPN